MEIETVNRVAIFGANGYLGRHLTMYLCDLGMGCDTFDIGEKPTLNVGKYSACDVTSKDFWNKFSPEQYSAIVFLAGLSGVERSFENAELFMQVNVMGLLGLLERVKGLGSRAPRIIFPSSRLVYEGGEVVDEKSLRSARSVYGASKIACEELLSAYYARYDVPYVTLRVCVPYGNLLSKNYSYGTIGFFMVQANSGKPIIVYGDGSCTKTYTYIGDICQIVAKCIGHDIPSGKYNIGGYEYSLKQVAEMIVAQFGGSWKTVPWPESALRVEMGNIALNAKKLNSAIGWIEYKKLEDYIGEL